MAFIDPVDSEDELDPEALGDEELEPQTEAEITIEDRARIMGWKPLPVDPRNIQRDEYRGDPRRWTDAAEFVAHGEAELPILRDQTRRMSERLVRSDRDFEDLKRTVEEQKIAIQDAIKLAKTADERGYKRAKSELEVRRREAAEAGDADTVDQISAEIEALQDARVDAPAPISPPPPPPPAEAAPVVAPEITQFVRDNPWFNDKKRPELNAAMIAMHNGVIRENPGMPVGEQLDIALGRMEAAYPEILDETPMREPAAPVPRRRAAPSALAPSGPQGQRPRGSGSPIDAIADPTERAQCRAAYGRMKANDVGFTEAEYMQIYEDPHADALELRRQRKK